MANGLLCVTRTVLDALHFFVSSHCGEGRYRVTIALDMSLKIALLDMGTGDEGVTSGTCRIRFQIVTLLHGR